MDMLTAQVRRTTAVDGLDGADAAGATPVLRVLGELTAATAGALRATVAALGGETAFIVDLSQVAGADQAALADLGSALEDLRVSGRTVVVVAPSGSALAAPLAELGFDRVASCTASVAGAGCC